MTDLELLEILERPVTNLEKALAIRSAITAKMPSALNIKPQVPRKKREAKQPKAVPALEHLNGLGPEGPTQ